MYKVFVLTPCSLTNTSIDKINNYIAKAADIFNSIAKTRKEDGEWKDAEIEFTNNFFIERDPNRIDTNPESVEVLRNSDDPFAYIAEEAPLIAEADAILLPANADGYEVSVLWNLIASNYMNMNGRVVIKLPIDFEGDWIL